MEKNKINILDMDVYQEQLSNGLKVFVIPMNNVKNIYVTFVSKFGSKDNTFIPIGENKMITVPDGVAHFLEHKIFEQEDGSDPMEFFSSRGASANAYTTFNRTVYLFEGPNFFEENINYLLDFVQSPYFTDENVEKEKGIIISEMNMYKDKPFSVLYDEINKSIIVKDPMRIPIIGTEESVNSITKEDLYKCYNTFYHPSNMFVVVTGNVDPEKTIGIIKNNQERKMFEKAPKIKVKEIKEPEHVFKEEVVLKMNVEIPKLAVSYKVPLSKFKKMPRYEYLTYIDRFFEIKLGQTSDFNERLINNGTINSSLYIDQMVINDDYLLVTIIGEAKEPEKLKMLIKQEILDRKINEEDFNRKNKVSLSNLFKDSDNIYTMNKIIMNDVLNYGDVRYDRYNQIKSLNFKNFKFVIENLDLNNSSCIIMFPKDWSLNNFVLK